MMLKTYLYVPADLDQKIILAAETLNESKAEIMRQALEKGIGSIAQQGTASARALIEIADIGIKNNLNGPSDGSAKMDEYLWAKDWNKDE